MDVAAICYVFTIPSDMALDKHKSVGTVKFIDKPIALWSNL